jgi:serine/threonine-protein kinase
MSSSRDHSVDRPPRAAREPTESIHLDDDGDSDVESDADLDEPAADLVDSLARGTGMPPEDRTKVATPAARNRTHPPRQVGGPPEDAGTRSSARARKPSAPPPRRDRGGEGPEAHLGEVLGSYRIIDVLGRGGMGFVYRAEHVKLGREVALKLLRADYAKRRDAVARFFQEARTVNRIRHRNIVDVTDFVELDDGTTFIIMELLRGQSLGKWAKKGFDAPRALAVLIQICDGLAAAHTVGVIHRDLKPDNVIIVPTPDGAELVKLLDFGVAKLVNRDDEDVGLETAAGSVIGTPAYMSPEQAGGMPVDARSDIYSVGAIMYELFCGQPMFRGRSFGEYVRKHLSELPPRPSMTAAGAGMDDRLEAAIVRAIEKDPNRRFDSIAELRDTLLHLLGAIETRPPGRELFTADLIPPGSAAGARQVLMAPALTPLPPPLVPPPSMQMPPVAPIAPPGAPTMAHRSVPWPATDTETPPAASHAPGMTTGISSLSQIHAAMVHQTQPPPTSTPWWVWFAGGALAVGLGIGGAVWYATRDDGVVQPPEPAPTMTALPDTPPAPGPRLVQIRFASTPQGGVYAVGSATELCRTPCTLDVDLRDGGAQDHRDYVIKAQGFADAPLRVALTGDQIDVPAVALVAVRAPVVIRDDPPDKTTRKDKDRGKDRDRDKDKDRDRDTDTEKPTIGKPELVPPETTPDTKTKDPTTTTKTKIDRTDTLDPFKENK